MSAWPSIEVRGDGIEASSAPAAAALDLPLIVLGCLLLPLVLLPLRIALATHVGIGPTVVRLHFFDGRTRRSPAPITSFPQPDPDFEAKLATIVQWWMYSTGQLQPPPAQPQVAPQH